MFNVYKFTIGCLLFTFIFVKPIFAQQSLIQGKVIDKSTKRPIANVSVRIDEKQTITNEKGEFLVNEVDSVQKRKRIKLTSIGYLSTIIELYKNKPFYIVELIPAINNLKEVKIVAKHETIIEKAIRKIPENYLTKDFMMEGINRIHLELVDSLETIYYAKSDAVLSIFHPSYIDHKKDIQVSVLQNRNHELKTNKFRDLSVQHVDGLISFKDEDLVFNRPAYLRKTKDFDYWSEGKTSINNIPVYIVNFKSKKSKKIEGTCYIDTLNYAFVALKKTTYESPIYFGNAITRVLKYDTYIQYNKINDKWFVDFINLKTTYSNSKCKTNINFSTIKIDSLNVKPIVYQDAIQETTRDFKINKLGSDNTWVAYQEKFNENENKGVMEKVIVPYVKVDSVRKIFKNKILKSILNYLVNDNYRIVFLISRLPLSFDKYQPLLDENISVTTPYAIGVGNRFRLYHNLFVGFDGVSNYAFTGIRYNLSNVGLSYNFITNKNGHPIAISPFIGYQQMKVSKDEETYFKQKSINFGLNVAYEMTHRWSVFGVVNYNYTLGEKNEGVLLTTQKIYPNIGFFYKFLNI